MRYKDINENPVFKAGQKHGKFIAKKIMPHTVKKREFIENQVDIEQLLRSENESYSDRKNHN